MVNYISLKEAQRYCRHSQDYLKLRARQGKLRALKIGRNWVTMKEWVEEYGRRRGERGPTSSRRSDLNGLNGAFLWFVMGLVVVTLLLLFSIEPAYLEWVGAKAKFFLADIGHIIPGRVVEF